MMAPAIRDKIIINDSGLRSFWFIIKGWFQGVFEVMAGGERMAAEIELHGWLDEPEPQKFLAEQEASCSKIDAACTAFKAELDHFHSTQLDRNNRMRLWIDKRRKQTP